MDAAKKFYEKVEQFPKSDVYGYAVYKKGWCYINLGDFKTALETFVERDPAGPGRQGRPTTSCGNAVAGARGEEGRGQGLRPHAGAGPDKAWDFFTRVGGDFAPKMMEALAELYWEQGMFADSTKVYHKLMALNPESPRLCEWQNKVVRNTLSAGTKKDQVQEINRLGIAYDRVKALPTAKKDQVDECRNVLPRHQQGAGAGLAQGGPAHQEPRHLRAGEVRLQGLPGPLPQGEGRLDMAFYYGEVLWTTQDWKDAAEQYTKVVQMDPKGKYVKEAAYAAVLAWKNALNIDDAGPGAGQAGGQRTSRPEAPADPRATRRR